MKDNLRPLFSAKIILQEFVKLVIQKVILAGVIYMFGGSNFTKKHPTPIQVDESTIKAMSAEICKNPYGRT